MNRSNTTAALLLSSILCTTAQTVATPQTQNETKASPPFVWIHGGGSGHDLPCNEGRVLAETGITMILDNKCQPLQHHDRDLMQLSRSIW